MDKNNKTKIPNTVNQIKPLSPLSAYHMSLTFDLIPNRIRYLDNSLGTELVENVFGNN